MKNRWKIPATVVIFSMLVVLSTVVSGMQPLSPALAQVPPSSCPGYFTHP